jgi:NhaA family Na+:H+ antiporter
MTTARRDVLLPPWDPFLGVVLRPFQAFLRLQAASGILLLLAAVAAFVWANVSNDSYNGVFEYPLALGAGGATYAFTLREFINDVLMSVFFFVVGMEINRELAVGELRTLRRASLPAVAAVGGMIVPVMIYWLLNAGTPAAKGWAIPIATDIAFSIGCLTVLKNRVPQALAVFLTAFAIFDDIGGILVIALFYGGQIQLLWVGIAVLVAGLLYTIGKRHVTNALVYTVVGVSLWYAVHHSGIHATIAGVVVGLMVPARALRSSREVLQELTEHTSGLLAKSSDEELESAEILQIEEKLEDLQAPLHRFVHALHPVVGFVIMPVFALANSGVSLAGMGVADVLSPVALGIALGLLVGKQIGIFSFTFAAVRLGLSPMPGDASYAKLYGVSVVAGIGFTVSLFIAGLAFHDAPELLKQAKLGVLLGSFIAGIIGCAVLAATQRLPRAEATAP